MPAQSDPIALDLFISHSSHDESLAKAIVELLRSALSISARNIRCTSVAGYKLDVGADTNAQLRTEVVESKVLVGLITDVSIESAYVLFELGARWGADKFMAPLLGAGKGSEILAGPLGGINALKCETEDLHQFVRKVGTELGKRLEHTESYLEHLNSVVEASEQLASERSSVKADEGSIEAAAFDGDVAVEDSLTEWQTDYLMTIGRPLNEGSIPLAFLNREGRENAMAREAVDLFVQLELMAIRDVFYCLTNRGWELADKLWRIRILRKLKRDEFLPNSKIAELVGLTNGGEELNEVQRHLKDLESEDHVDLSEDMDGMSAQLTLDGVTVVRRSAHTPSR